jgi:hypothetical protein
LRIGFREKLDSNAAPYPKKGKKETIMHNNASKRLDI